MMWLFVLVLGGSHLLIGLCNMIVGLLADNPPKYLNELIAMDMIIAVWAIILLIKET